MVSNLELQNKIAILLVSHGSSLPFAEVTFNEIKDKFNKATEILNLFNSVVKEKYSLTL